MKKNTTVDINSAFLYKSHRRRENAKMTHKKLNMSKRHETKNLPEEECKLLRRRFFLLYKFSSNCRKCWTDEQWWQKGFNSFLCIDAKDNYLTITKEEPTDKIISA